MPSRPIHQKFGVSESEWNAYKKEAREHMSAAAAKRAMITYGDLASKMTTIEVRAHDQMLWEIIGSVAADEENAGRGLLSVIVVHKHGDMAPGPGFFELAKYFGRDTRDKTACFIAEVNKVHYYWSVKNAARPADQG